MSGPNAARYMNRVSEVILQEASALKLMAEAVDVENIEKFVDAVMSLKGRIIVTGMGKSGHIARKTAATMSSTGSPAYYVHPSEASHGDLGQITAADMVIALSYSGETSELADLVYYCRRNDIPLAAITFNHEGALAKAANIPLVLPVQPEACPNNLAPTTSTTMMLAFGDALALLLLDCKQFSPNDFRRLHPGGSLGRRLSRIGDFMKKGEELPLIEDSASIRDGINTMTEKRLGCAGITRDRKLVGLITDGDLRRLLEGKNEVDLTAAIGEVFRCKPPYTISSDRMAADAIRIMNEHKVTVLFVLDAADKAPIGVVHLHDCLRLAP